MVVQGHFLQGTQGKAVLGQQVAHCLPEGLHNALMPQLLVHLVPVQSNVLQGQLVGLAELANHLGILSTLS